ncbi:MAG: hypothetical protein JNL70_18020 [Saprospiraceae bacterium]|nr:hypothetical protein [Saprospiraceae bacterium]
MKNIILRAFKRAPEAKGYAAGLTVYQRMNNNPQFASEQSLVDQLKVKREIYDAAKGEAANGDRIKIGIKNDCYKAFIDQLDKIADAVEIKADGDVRVAQDAGFETRSTTNRSIDFLKTPTGLKVEDVQGRKGVIKVSRDNDPDAPNTVIEYQVQGEADAPWLIAVIATANITLVPGLPSGKYVAIRIYSSGRKTLKSDTTEPVVVLVS